MAVNINADTTTGLELTSDTSGNINIQNDGTTVVAVTSSGAAVTGNLTVDTDTLYVDATNNRVGIGTSSPTNNLQIYNNGATSGQIHITNASTGATASDGVLFGYDGSNDVIINNQEATATKFYTNAAERMRIDSSGSVRIGTTASYSLNEKLALYGTSTANNPTIISDKAAAGTVSSNHVLFNNSNGYVGSITTLNSGTAYNTSSDYRLKENVSPMSGSINRLKQLKPSTWTWVHGGNGEGFLAHEAQAVVPEAVTGTKDAVDDDGNPVYQGIDQSKLVPLLTAALQEAITKIEDLETRIQALENA